MEVACPDTLERMMGKTLSSEVAPVLKSSKDTACESIFRSWSIDHDKNDKEINAPMNNTAGSHEKDISDLQSKLRDLEIKLNGVSNQDSANNHTSSRAQNKQYDQQLTKLEQKMDDLRLALQIHTSSTDIMSESIQYLYGKTSEMEDKLVHRRRSAP